jgi:hypothetical protein
MKSDKLASETLRSLKDDIHGLTSKTKPDIVAKTEPRHEAAFLVEYFGKNYEITIRCTDGGRNPPPDIDPTLLHNAAEHIDNNLSRALSILEDSQLDKQLGKAQAAIHRARRENRRIDKTLRKTLRGLDDD